MIDDHVHPFSLTFEPLDLDSLSLDVGADDDAGARHAVVGPTRLSSAMLRARLSAYLGCAPGEVETARDERARQSWPEHVRALFADSATSALVMDAGIAGLPPGAAQQYEELAGVRVWELARLEPLVDRMIGDGASAAEIVAAVNGFMDDQARAGAVGFKTVLAYRTGLAVDPRASLDDAERSLRDDRAAGIPVRRTAKPLRDLVFRTALARCADLGRPIQVHTGFGDSEIRLAESDPLLLEEVLRTPEGSSADVVLIHASYPWHEQAGWLAGVHPRLWTEYSLCNLFSPATTADRLLRLLDIAPAGRVTLGSDGHGMPESLWFGCVVLRDAWREVRLRLRGSVDDGWLDDVEERIFERNARELYRLPAA
jgi:predicted TIM-barrel fold metal-dependent hydrolase